MVNHEGGKDESETAKKKSKWQRRARWIILLTSTILGILLANSLSRTNLIREIDRASYVAIQGELASQLRSTNQIKLVDLSLLVPPNPASREMEAGTEDDNKVASELAGLDYIVQEISKSQPKAIVMDWEIGLPPEYIASDESSFRFNPQVGFQLREAYDHLISTFAKLKSKSPVFFLSDNAAELRANGKVTLPRSLGEFSQASGKVDELSDESEFAPYIPWSNIQPITGAKLPSLADALISQFEIPDRANDEPTKWGLFESEELRNGTRSVLVNYGFVPSLIDSALFIEPLSFKLEKGTGNQFRGKIVFLCDLTVPTKGDYIQIPISPRLLKVSTNNGEVIACPGSGGIYWACAFLTRTEHPIYRLPKGWPEWFLVGSFSVIVGLLTSLLSSAIGRGVSESKKERIETLVELLVLMISTVLIIVYLPPGLARFGLLVPQVGSFVAMRSLDVLGLVMWQVYRLFDKAT